MKGVFLCFLIYSGVVLCSQVEARRPNTTSTTRGGVVGRPVAESPPLVRSLMGKEPVLLYWSNFGLGNMELQAPFTVNVITDTTKFECREVIVKKYCIVEFDERDKMISILPKPAPAEGLPNNPDEAVFLPYSEDANTFMFLPAKQGVWFFTAPLTGCDVFVATDKNSNVLVIHGNTNKAFEKEGELVALQMKGEAADKIIASKGYQSVKARVYHTPTLPSVQRYLENYHKDHKLVERWTYDNAKAGGTFLFFGYYDKAWQFYLKSANGGATQTIRIAK